MVQIIKLYTRIYRKLSRILERHIPFNQSYKPIGYYKTLPEYVSSTGADYIEIYPSQESTLEIPEEFFRASQGFYNVAQTGIMTAAAITAINKGRLYTDATNFVTVITEDNKVIGDISLHVGKPDVEENGIFKQSYFSSPVGLKGNVFHTLIGGSGENNYFHWMFDSLPRLHLLEKAGWFNKIDWFVVPKHKLSYQKDTLRMLGINTTKIVEGHKLNHIQADNLISTTFVRNIEHIPEWACQFLRDKFLPMAHSNKQDSKRIYISRQDSDTRTVLNEEKVEKLLAKYGFETVVLSEFTFSEQIGLFSTAEIIISPHGAGLTNLVFCQKGAIIIELFAEEYMLSLYADLASKVELDYNYIISHTHPKASNLKAAMRKGITVPIDKLEELIQQKIVSSTCAAEALVPEANTV